MSRPFRTLCSVFLAALSVASTGCGTIYTRMYSPKKSYYVRPPSKVEPSALELLKGDPQANGGPGLPPSSVVTPGNANPPMLDAPAIPGLPQ